MVKRAKCTSCLVLVESGQLPLFYAHYHLTVGLSSEKNDAILYVLFSDV